ncbi:hypothetical protein TGAM01_v201586 [Trichoderma gamsii]|uniref:Uncharacterized protein n=1 Tax=Trichoderma gamsii TaxID=398673 RepID=A0A2P4ZYG0_9HYPO|nr:hypothetical protein TGAM01_v201586 [Trichoderma gamsii]PON29337.1 hypothetical protein TGAM01_v201586 [Trichoderma gamsii]
MVSPRFRAVTRSFRHMPSYRRYLNANPITGRKERLDDLMPSLQYNASGQLILAPGEVFCRWRNDDGTLCKRESDDGGKAKDGGNGAGKYMKRFYANEEQE